MQFLLVRAIAKKLFPIFSKGLLRTFLLQTVLHSNDKTDIHNYPWTYAISCVLFQTRTCATENTSFYVLQHPSSGLGRIFLEVF